MPIAVFRDSAAFSSLLSTALDLLLICLLVASRDVDVEVLRIVKVPRGPAEETVKCLEVLLVELCRPPFVIEDAAANAKGGLD